MASTPDSPELPPPTPSRRAINVTRALVAATLLTGAVAADAGGIKTKISAAVGQALNHVREPLADSSIWSEIILEKFKKHDNKTLQEKDLEKGEEFVPKIQVVKSYVNEDVPNGTVAVRSLPSPFDGQGDPTEIGRIKLGTVIHNVLLVNGKSVVSPALHAQFAVVPCNNLQGDLIDKDGKTIQTDPKKACAISAAYTKVLPQV